MGSERLPVPEAAADGLRIAGQIEGIPLFLIPKTIAEQIRKKQKSVFLITVKRNFMHQYTVIVETHDEYDQRVNPEVPGSSKKAIGNLNRESEKYNCISGVANFQ